jgi:Chlorophyll A-B binding protein
MIAAVGILVSEIYHPLFGGEVSGPAINYFSQIGFDFWLKLVAFIGLVEAYSIFTAWAPRKDTKGTVGWLTDSYTPGDLGFDPLGLLSRSNQKEMRTKELQNGRLAMLAVAGIVVQELVDGKTVLDSFFGSL